MKLIFKSFYYLLLFAFAIIAVGLTSINLPITGSYQVLSVLSGSMEPTIKTGSLVVVRPQPTYHLGDVITFATSPNTLATHRLYAITQDPSGNPLFTTKGDANDAPDGEPIRRERVQGAVWFSLPYLGYVIESAKKPVGFMLIIVIPATIIIYDEFKNIYKEISRLRHKRKDNLQDQDIADNEQEIARLKQEVSALKKKLG